MSFDPSLLKSDLRVESGNCVLLGYQTGDRFGHVVLHEGELTAWVLCSVEGDDSPGQPPSAVLQELVSEIPSVGKPPALMGLGSAGKSYWSCSIEADSTLEAIAFDFACKTRSEEWLGSTYEIAPAWTIQRQTDRDIVLLNGESAYRLVCIGNSRLQVDTEGRRLSISADQKPPLKGPRRWRYVIGDPANLTI